MTNALLNEQAALWLDDMHTRLARYEPLPEKLTPETLESAYGIQAALVRRMQLRGLKPLGHKIALSSPEMQKMVGIDRPVGGVIVGRDILSSPARVRAANHGRLCIECEVAVRLGTTLSADTAPFSDADIAAAIDACAAAFEIVDDRNADYRALDVNNLVADNTWNAGIVLGPIQELSAEMAGAGYPALADATVTLQENGTTVSEGSGGDALGHPFNSVRALANELVRQGRTLKAGEWILTGSVIRTHFPDVGSKLVCRHSVLGDVEIEVV